VYIFFLLLLYCVIDFLVVGLKSINYQGQNSLWQTAPVILLYLAMADNFHVGVAILIFFGAFVYNLLVNKSAYRLLNLTPQAKVLIRKYLGSLSFPGVSVPGFGMGHRCCQMKDFGLCRRVILKLS